MRTRTSFLTRKPKQANIWRTWRFSPCSSTTQARRALRRDTYLALACPSGMRTPLSNCSSTLLSNAWSSVTQYSFSMPPLGWPMVWLSAPLLVKINKPSLSASKRPM